MPTNVCMIESENEDDHFSDASEGHKPVSPIPMTRIEKVDDELSHGQVPGTAAYDMRSADAVPDEVEVVPEGEHSSSWYQQGPQDRSLSPGGAPLPKTVVEEVEPASTSFTSRRRVNTLEKHRADAEPDVVLHVSEESSPTAQPIPTTVVSKVDAEPSYGEVPGTDAYDMRKEDAEPDVIKEIGDIPGTILLTLLSTPSERLTESESPTSPLLRSDHRTYMRRKGSGGGSLAIAEDGGFGPMHLKETIDQQDRDDDGFGDDFDDFEEGESNDDFGDFDEGLQQPLEEAGQIDKDVGVQQSLPTTRPSFVSSDHSLMTFATWCGHVLTLKSLFIAAEADRRSPSHCWIIANSTHLMTCSPPQIYT